MADIEYSGNFGPQEGTRDDLGAPLGRALSIAGALTSLVLVVGVGVWGYRLLVRDVSGVPVVRALEGPMREQPGDPGGTAASYQGLAVNAIAAQGTAAKPADRLVLAPRTVALTDEDAPMARAEPKQPETGAGTASETGAETASETGGSATGKGAASEQTVAALVQELTANVKPISVEGGGDEKLPVATPVAARIEHPAPVDPGILGDAVHVANPALLNAPGVKVSLRPMVRPVRAVAGEAPKSGEVLAKASENAGLDIDPDTLPKGTRLAQLGAYDTPEIARAAWGKVSARFVDYMDGKKRVIQQASSGGRTFYRLRALGFEDLSDARRFCAALVAENADCIPVTVR